MDGAFLALRRDYEAAMNENDELREHIQAQEMDSSSTTALEARLAAIQAESDRYRDQVETAKIKERDAIRAETSARMSQAEAERVKNEVIADREAAENRARAAEARVRELEAAYGSDTFRFQVKSLERDCQRLQDDLKAEREQHMRSENENDARVDQLQRASHDSLALFKLAYALDRATNRSSSSSMANSSNSTICWPAPGPISQSSRRCAASTLSHRAL